MAGQVAFHLMDQDHVTRAPWGITTLVSCLPVLVLGMGTALAHMLREDAAAADQPDSRSGGPVGPALGPGPQSGPEPASGPAGPSPGSPGRDHDHSPARFASRDQRPHAHGGLGSTARCRRARRFQSSGPGRSSGILDCSQASHSRETRVPAGTAQRRSERVQRESERTRPPAQFRIRQRAGRRPVGSQGRAAH
jgi:hypothetical protein